MKRAIIIICLVLMLFGSVYTQDETLTECPSCDEIRIPNVDPECEEYEWIEVDVKINTSAPIQKEENVQQPVPIVPEPIPKDKENSSAFIADKKMAKDSFERKKKGEVSLGLILGIVFGTIGVAGLAIATVVIVGFVLFKRRFQMRSYNVMEHITDEYAFSKTAEEILSHHDKSFAEQHFSDEEEEDMKMGDDMESPYMKAMDH